MVIQKDSRQIPSSREIVKKKDYCDLLYAWLQCNSERISLKEPGRRIRKTDVKWTKIEKDFTRTDFEGNVVKVMSRKTIAKYFGVLEAEGLIELRDDDFYYLTVLGRSDATLVHYETLRKMINTIKQDGVSIYVYLLNKFLANQEKSFIITMKEIKEFIGIATSTTSNNILVGDVLELLKRLGLIDYGLVSEELKTFLKIFWVRNRLPDL